MKLVIDLRRSITENNEISGGGIYCFKQYELLKSFDPFLLIQKSSHAKILPTNAKYILATEAQSFFISNQGLFVSGIPYDIYRFDLSKWKVIVTIHSFRYLDEPHDFLEPFYSKTLRQLFVSLTKTVFPILYRRFRLFQYRKLISLKCLRFKIITDTYVGKSLIQSYFPSVDITVLYPLSDISEINASTHKKIDYKYFVMLNSNRWVKNYVRAYWALHLYNRHIIDKFRIISTGNPNLLIRLFFSKQVHFIGYVSEEELCSLINCSEGLIFPSLSEGFGYPPLRALKLNIKVFASNLPVLQEIYGNSLFYFNPLSSRDIFRSLLYSQNQFSNNYNSIIRRQSDDANEFKNLVEEWLNQE